jgi:hypothetical protein
MELNEHLRQMLKELGQAINESISGSGRVHDSIQRIRDEGYNLYMVLDAKVGVNKRDRSSRRKSGSRGSREGAGAARAGERAEGAAEASALEPGVSAASAAFRINVKDLRFLKSLGIDPTRKVRSVRSTSRRRPASAAATASRRGVRSRAS